MQILKLVTLALAVAAGRPTHVASFSWPGIYDLVGSGFPDGDRYAVMHVARDDSSYSLVALRAHPASSSRSALMVTRRMSPGT